MDLTEQFSHPDTAPPMLARLLEAIEKKGELNTGNLVKVELLSNTFFFDCAYVTFDTAPHTSARIK